MKPQNNKPRGNTKSNQFLLVVNSKIKEPLADTLSDLATIQETLIHYSRFKYIFTIIHDKDPIKTPHLHAYITLYEAITLHDLLNELIELLNCVSEQLSLEPTYNDFLGVQYLIHKNDLNKEPYELECIKTNNNEELLRRMALKYQSEEDTIREALSTSDTMQDLLTKISLADAKKYQSIWTTLLRERKKDIESLGEAYNQAINDYNALYNFTTHLLATLRNTLNEHEKRLIDLDGYENTLNEFNIL